MLWVRWFVRSAAAALLGLLMVVFVEVAHPPCAAQGQSGAFCKATNGKVTTAFSTGHQAIDISGAGGFVKGPAVYAPYDGSVVYIGIAELASDNPNKVKHALAINHGQINGTYVLSFYVHMGSTTESYIPANLAVGAHVTRGQLIGYQGFTGKASGTHLHWEIHEYSQPFLNSYNSWGTACNRNDLWWEFGGNPPGKSCNNPNPASSVTPEKYAGSMPLGSQVSSSCAIIPAKMDINKPGGGETVAGKFLIGGWAIHEAASSGTGVDQLHIYFDGPAGSGARGVAAAYGIQRDDVAAAFGDRFRYSGFHLEFSSAELSVGQHTVYVYAHSTTTDQWQLMTRTFNVANTPPNIPNLLAPANGGWVSGQSVTLQWQDTGDFDNRPSGARNYSGWIWKSDNSWSREIAWQNDAGASLQLPSAGTYYWKIQSGDGWVGSGFSAPWTFTVNQPPIVPTLLEPANDSTLSKREVTLEWQAADDPDHGPNAARNYSGWIWSVDNSWNYEIPWQDATSVTVQVPADGSYYWKIQSGDGAVGSGFSAPWIFTVLTIPKAPSNLRQSDTSADLLAIGWDDNAANETGFKIYKWGWDGTQWEFLLYDAVGANATLFTDSNLSCSSDYYYQVSAYNGGGESARAGWIKASTSACPVPVAPDQLAIAGATDSSLVLHWRDASYDEQGFNIYKWRWNGMFWDFVYLTSVGVNDTSFSDTGLACEADYYYTVSAFNAVGESSQSSWAKGTTGACPAAEPTATGTAVAPPTGTPTSTVNIPPTATATAAATATSTATSTPTGTPTVGAKWVFIPYIGR